MKTGDFQDRAVEAAFGREAFNAAIGLVRIFGHGVKQHPDRGLAVARRFFAIDQLAVNDRGFGEGRIGKFGHDAGEAPRLRAAKGFAPAIPCGLRKGGSQLFFKLGGCGGNSSRDFPPCDGISFKLRAVGTHVLKGDEFCAQLTEQPGITGESDRNRISARSLRGLAAGIFGCAGLVRRGGYRQDEFAGGAIGRLERLNRIVRRA